MPHLATLRVLLAIQLLAAAISISLDLSGRFALDGVLGEAQGALLEGAFSVSQGLALAFLPVALVSLVGVWRGRRWGRSLYTLTSAVALLLLDSSVSHPVENLLGTVECLAEGALLAMMWLAPAAVPDTCTVRFRATQRGSDNVIDAA